MTSEFSNVFIFSVESQFIIPSQVRFPTLSLCPLISSFVSFLSSSPVCRSFRSFVRSLVHCFVYFSQDVPIPWKAIFTSLPLWAIVLAHFTQTWGLYTMLSELPLYFNQRLHFDLKQVTMTRMHMRT